jgi:hypothetical protein
MNFVMLVEMVDPESHISHGIHGLGDLAEFYGARPATLRLSNDI